MDFTLTLRSNRRLDNKLNAFEGLHRSPYFLSLLALIAAVQVALVQFGGKTAGVAPLNVAEWAVCIALGFLSILSGILIRFIFGGTSSPAAKFGDPLAPRDPAPRPLPPGRIVTPDPKRRRHGPRVLVVQEGAIRATRPDERTPLLEGRRDHAG
jgi:hypothetical protein